MQQCTCQSLRKNSAEVHRAIPKGEPLSAWTSWCNYALIPYHRWVLHYVYKRSIPSVSVYMWVALYCFKFYHGYGVLKLIFSVFKFRGIFFNKSNNIHMGPPSISPLSNKAGRPIHYPRIGGMLFSSMSHFTPNVIHIYFYCMLNSILHLIWDSICRKCPELTPRNKRYLR